MTKVGDENAREEESDDKQVGKGGKYLVESFASLFIQNVIYLFLVISNNITTKDFTCCAEPHSLS